VTRRAAAEAAAAAAAAVGQLTQATTLHFTYVQQKGAKSGSSFSQLLQPQQQSSTCQKI